MTPAEVAAIRKAWAGTTQGTWQKDRNWHISLVGIDWNSYSPRDKVICQVNGPSYHAARDEDFIIAAHNTFVPALCDALEAAWAQVAALEAENDSVYRQDEVDVNNPYACAKCGRTDVRLYRSYGSFLRREEIFCNAHLPKGDLGWWVPLIVDPRDNTVWGYTSAPAPDIAAWRNLPDGDPRGPLWSTADQWTNR